MPRPSRRLRSATDDARRTTRSQRARSPVSSDNESDAYSDEKPVTRRRGRRVSTPRYESTPIEDEDEEDEEDDEEDEDDGDREIDLEEEEKRPSKKQRK